MLKADGWHGLGRLTDGSTFCMANLCERRGRGCCKEAAALLSRKHVGRRWAGAHGSVHPRPLSKALTGLTGP